MQDFWFIPKKLHFQSIHVRGNTNWVSFELGDADGTFGAGEITSTQLDKDVAPVVAQLANKLRDERLTSDDDVLRLNGLTPSDLEENRSEEHV